MAENKHQEHYESFGVPRDFYTSMKWFGMRLVDVFFVVGATVLAMQTGSGRIFPIEQVWQYVAFCILTFIMAVYLILPHNSGKNNGYAILLFLIHRRHKYLSMGRITTGPKDK